TGWRPSLVGWPLDGSSAELGGAAMLLKAHHGPPIDLDPEEDPTGRTRRWGKIFAPQDESTRTYRSAGAVAPVTPSPDWSTLSGDDAMSSEVLRAARAEWHEALLLLQACFEDYDFPAEAKSIGGRDEDAPRSSSEPPRCRCGKNCKKSEVRKEGPTKGRPYWHCETRRCGFFSWADSDSRRSEKIWWQRFPDFLVVSDFGFRAEDLKQGGVGDCWFLSALAVVAQRPDLILRLFGGETARNAAGCYQINLFLDGEWKAVTIDDRLPCTDQQRRPDGSGLAFSRADGQQLWVPLLEKAYAKAHGSYRAISGGEIAEALLDLTGCPTESIDFDEPGFDPQELWRRLLEFKAADFPMGCATAGNPELREVGLCGNHAYSVLDVREIFDPRFMGREVGYGGAQQDGMVRLLRIRNPHGVGEWNGEWSDKSAEWTESLSSELGCTGVDDGTFWMDYMHFLMAFQVVDVCLAHRGWHAASFSNAFCAKSSGSRICKNMYELRCDRPTTLYAMALQPTKRGAWCRDDRKKSYKPGDISLLLMRLSQAGEFEQVIGGNFFCADIMARRCIEAKLEDPSKRYLLVAFSLGAGPVAHGGEVRGSAPFKMRLFSSQPLGVRAVESDRHPQLAASALTGFHTAPLTLNAAPGRRFRRLLRRPGSNLCLFQVSLRATVNKFIFSRLIEAVSSRDLHTCLLWGSGGAFRYFLSQAGQGEDSRRMMVEQPGWLFDRLNLARSQAKVQFYCWEPQSKGKTVSLEPHLNTSLFTRVLAVSAGSRGGAICALKWLALPIVSPPQDLSTKTTHTISITSFLKKKLLSGSLPEETYICDVDNSVFTIMRNQNRKRLARYQLNFDISSKTLQNTAFRNSDETPPS
ncbi:unnamed protein product, partial [Durusdinium trenchii]